MGSGRVLVLVLALTFPSVAPGPGPAPPAAAEGSARTPPAGAVSMNESLRGLSTVWGHEDLPRGRLEALPEFDLLLQLQRHAPGRECRDALESALQARGQLQLAELRMNYASVRLPDALLSGEMYHLGDFDACLELRGASYCPAEVEIRPGGQSAEEPHIGDELSPFDPPHEYNATLSDFLRISGNRRRYRRDLQQWGLCLPSECSVALGLTLAGALDPLARSLQMELRVHVDQEACIKSQRPSLLTAVLEELNNPLFLLGTIFLLSFPILTIIATALRVAKKLSFLQESWMAEPEKQGTLSRLLSCFAAPSNWKHLKRKQKSQIHAIQGLRTLTMFGVILGHRCLTTFGGPLNNPEYVESSYLDVFKMYIVNGNIIVSTFFVISGFLEAKQTLTQIEKMKGFSVRLLLISYIHRYLRLLPALAFMVTFECLWTPLVGSGPIWDSLVVRSSEDCRDNWWANLLFINNYLSPGSMCMYQTWFLAADMQLYLLTLPLLWLVHRLGRGKLTATLLGAVLLGAACSLYFTTMLRDLHPVLLVFPQLVRNQGLFTDPTFTQLYVATHTNALPYVIGIITGIVFFHLNKMELQLSTRTRYMLTMSIPSAHVLHSAAIYLGILLFLPSIPARPWLDALYGPARQILFSVASAWVVLICALGCGGMFDWLFCWTPLLTLGRLTYCAYLAHITIINITAASVRQPVHLSDFSVALTLFSDILFSYFTALVLHLCVEAPMWNLQKIVINNSIKNLEKKQTDVGKAAGQNHVEDGPSNNNEDGNPAQLNEVTTLPQSHVSRL